MQVTKKVLGKSSIRLVPLGDIHLGHRSCDIDLLEKTINYIAYHDDAMWIGMGDYCDAITAKDKRYNSKEIDPNFSTPDVQYREITRMLEPIKEKCIGLLDGNHDYIHWKLHSHNYVDQMAFSMKVPYLTTDAYIRFSFPRAYGKPDSRERHEFNIYAHHGWSGGRKDGYNVNVIQDLAQIFPGLNMYIQGHNHKRGEAPLKVQLEVNRSMEVVQREERFLFTGSYLRGYVDGYTSYVEEKAYPPTALGSPVIVINSYHCKGRAQATKKQEMFDVHVEDVTEIE